MHTRSLQDKNDRDQITSLQLSQLSLSLQELKAMGERSETEHRILESLRYQRMEARQEKIIDAHAQTFEWIFDPHISSSRLPSKDNFSEWLTSGNDIFWITGKAGSGKSTLMKFLCHHKSSTSALKRWANEKELITAAHYFWHAGTELQKSQEGLLQSLLYGVLSQCPEIMPQILPKRWELCTRTHAISRRWTRRELLTAFSEMSLQSTLKKRFCFFIDGLDEYGGDHSDIVDLVQGFASSKDIKLCLSSRPWNVFTRAFGWGSHPKLHLEYLTQPDIKAYVQDTLGSNILFCQLAAGKDSARCKGLEDAIVSRAQGVFLWVFLVVRSLMEGLTNADRITDLERRLQSLPTDLEAYFRHMLENIEDVYVQQTVQTFHIALQAVEPLNLMTYAMMDELEDNPQYAIELPVQEMARTEIESRCQDMKLRINARCKDLLQITKRGSHKLCDANSCNVINLTQSPSLPLPKPISPTNTLGLENVLEDESVQSEDFVPFAEPVPTVGALAPQDTTSKVVSNDEQSLHPFFEYEVDFLHRTVKDFFQVNDIQSFIASHIPKTFDSCTLLSHAFLAQIKVAPIEMHLATELYNLVDDMVHYAHEAETQTGHPSVLLLDALSNVVQIPPGPRAGTRARQSVWWKKCQSFLGFAVQRDLQLYVTHKLDEHLHHGLPAWENDELVLDALKPLAISKYEVQSPNRTMLRILVDRGVDLNRPLRPFNVWDHVIHLICRQWDYTRTETRIHQLEMSTTKTMIHQLEMVIALLEVGAEPNQSLGPDRLRWVQFILIPPENWRTNYALKKALTKTIIAFCERGIDPYWDFQGQSLWCHFMRSIYVEDYVSNSRDLDRKKCELEVVRKFMSLGARLDDTIYQDVKKYEDGLLVGLESLTATDILSRIFTTTELETIYPESSKAKMPGARRRKKKKRRKERNKGVGH